MQIYAVTEPETNYESEESSNWAAYVFNRSFM